MNIDRATGVDLDGPDPTPNLSDDQYCRAPLATDGGPLRCTWPVGHAGPHIAGMGELGIAAAWPQEGESDHVA